MEWENDPEWIAMKKQFVASFAERALLLEKALASINNEPQDAQKKIQFVAHKIAGVAASYGFEELTQLGAQIDDGLDTVLAPSEFETEIKPQVYALIQALKAVQS